jgi:hypothetical protein
MSLLGDIGGGFERIRKAGSGLLKELDLGIKKNRGGSILAGGIYMPLASRLERETGKLFGMEGAVKELQKWTISPEGLAATKDAVKSIHDYANPPKPDTVAAKPDPADLALLETNRIEADRRRRGLLGRALLRSSFSPGLGSSGAGGNPLLGKAA